MHEYIRHVFYARLQVIAREYAEKMAFIDSVPLFSDWSVKWKKHLAASFRKESFLFDTPVFRQGEDAHSMYFILRYYTLHVLYYGYLLMLRMYFILK